MSDSSHLRGVFEGLQARFEGDLAGARLALKHPGAKGDASESDWLAFLKNHLPHRYRADKAFVLDSKGSVSDQLDVVVYDRQYAPLLYNQAGQLYVPAEAVYAVAEVKQSLSKAYVEYAGSKAHSVRALHRSSAPIPHAGGKYEPKPLHDIPAGILCFESSWSPPLGEPCRSALEGLHPTHRLDFGCVLKDASFEVDYPDGSVSLSVGTTGLSLVEFLLSLLRRLQGHWDGVCHPVRRIPRRPAITGYMNMPPQATS